MGDTRTALSAQAAAATMALNGHGQATAAAAAAPKPTLASSAPPTPHLGPAAPVPQLSPTPGGRIGRRLHTKVLEELKNATHRKSPAINPNATPAGAHAPLPSPLNLQALSVSEAPTDSSASMLDTTGVDTNSPRLPAPLNGAGGKSKTCGICERSFTVFRAKHTCKICGRKICDDCSKNRVKLNRRLERRRGSRLCDACARDHIQFSPPLVSPTSMQIPEEHDGTDDSSRGGEGDGRGDRGDAAKTGGRSLSRDEGTHDRLQRAASSIKNSFLPSTEYEHSAEGASYLRPRHWFSLVGVACVLLARILRFQSASNHSGLAFVLLSLTHWIDHIASLRVIGPYLVGLVVYDEVTARSQQPPPLHSYPLSSISSTRRSRTRSSISDSGMRRSSKTMPASIRPHDDDEVLEVQVGDKQSDSTDGFSFEKLHTSLVECTTKIRTPDGEMKLTSFLSACENVCGFILVFGRATAFAASTVTGYMSTITTNIAAWPVPANGVEWNEQSVRAIVVREVELQIAATGGKKKPSCCRCILRLMWFIEFVEACVRYTLVENMDEHCAAGASKAYEETIGVRHPWLIRKGVNSALASLPLRSAIIKSLHLQELSPDECLVQLKKVQMNMRTLIDEVTAVLKEHQLMDIK